jgi:hypothetical protein
VAVTVSVSVTVTPVNDPPQIEAPETYDANEGAEVLLPLTVSDADGDELTLAASDLPPGLQLELVDAAIAGVVEAGAAAGSPYLATITVSDAAGEMATLTITWNIAPAAGEGAAPPEDTAPAEVVVTPVVAPLPVAAAASTLPGSDALAGYVWAPPDDFGDCPVVDGALTPRSSDSALPLFAEATATMAGGGPLLQVTVDALAPGEYDLFICGCAPTYTSADQASAALANDSVYAAVNGAPILLPDGAVAAPIAGFAETSGFTWRNTWVDEMTGASGPARVTVAAGGPQVVELSMAEDGLLIYSVALAPVDAEEPVNGAVCALQ